MRGPTCALGVLVAALVAAPGNAEEAKEPTPAVEAAKAPTPAADAVKAPAPAAEAAKEPAPAAEPAKEPAPAAEASAPTASPQAAVEPVKAVEPSPDLPFDPTGRRDPFHPPRWGFGTRTGDPPSPLQRYDIGQLRLVAIIYNTQDPRAVVEDEEGLGYIVKVGTAIGPNGGQVQSIERGKLVIQEGAVDFYGDAHPTSVVMELRTADMDRARDRGKR
jgi:type IV pilus assembly protein PilP